MKVQRRAIDSLEFSKMSFRHDSGVPIFTDVSFRFPMDKCLWLHSDQSGSGATTLMQILSGLWMPTEGDYQISGLSVPQTTFEDFLPFRLNIGYAFDTGGLLHNQTVLENLMLPLLYHQIYDYKEAQTQVVNLLRSFEIDRFAKLRPSLIPGSVRKLAVLLRPLLLQPELLILDEPWVGLNDQSVLQYKSLLLERRQKYNLRHILLSSRDSSRMHGLADLHLEINDGNQPWQIKSLQTEKNVVGL